VAEALAEVDRGLIGKEFEHSRSEPITAEEMIRYARACGETDPRYLEDGPDLIGSPTFAITLKREKYFPDGVSRDLLFRGMDAGKDVEIGVPVRPGDVLSGVGTLHEIYEKTGRSGKLTFMVLRQVVTNQRGEMVAVIDQKMMFR
jgi:acyl dehydratase